MITHKNRYMLIVLQVFFLSGVQQVYAQSDNLYMAAKDTSQLDYPILSAEHYLHINPINKKYNQELINKKHNLMLKAFIPVIAGAAIIAGGSVWFIQYGEKRGWSGWAYKPPILFADLGICIGLSWWAYSYQKKSEAINITTIYFSPINENLSLGLAHFTNLNESAFHTVGIGIKVSF